MAVENKFRVSGAIVLIPPRQKIFFLLKKDLKLKFRIELQIICDLELKLNIFQKADDNLTWSKLFLGFLNDT